ncbi:MAG: N-6 DNA methylase [Candidatus Omnitrophota bacterium]
MKRIKTHQNLPRELKAREKLREKGQFWTPPWVAEAMVEYAIKDSALLFDPAVGKGAFYSALRNIRGNQQIQFYGTDKDENILQEAFKEGLLDKIKCDIEIRDFIFNPPCRKFKAIVANPPYIRHHRLNEEIKRKLKELSEKILRFTIDGRAGIHIYFLIQALNLLELNGRLAFIMPADTCEGVFAEKLWRWIIKHYCIEGVITFLPQATPFPNVDTNAIVFLIKNKNPNTNFSWVISKEAYSDDLKNLIKSDFQKLEYPTLDIVNRDLKEAIQTGLSRHPNDNNGTKYKLYDFVKVMRGIATGANEFFYLTKEQIKQIGISDEFLKPAVGRTRDVDDAYITKETIEKLEKKNRPTFLFSLDGRRLEEFPNEIQKYVKHGEEIGINKRILIQTRRPWYKMEQRKIPEFLFAYLGRRNSRFIKNEANVLPLTGFLCVYPNSDDKEYKENLWKMLNDEDILENLKLVGKSYGSGALKVEPRSLERLPVPEKIVEKYHLKPKERNVQIELFEK